MLFLDDFAMNPCTEIPGTLPLLQSIFKLIISVAPHLLVPTYQLKLIDKSMLWQVWVYSTVCWCARRVKSWILLVIKKKHVKTGEGDNVGICDWPVSQPLVDFLCRARHCSRWTDSSFSAAVNSGDHRQLLEIRCLGVSSLFMSSPACEHE